MLFNSKKTSLVILGVTSTLLARAVFLSINDPEGPNLLIVIVMSVIIYSISLATLLLLSSGKKKKYYLVSQITAKEFLAILFIQIILSGFLLYFLK